MDLVGSTIQFKPIIGGFSIMNPENFDFDDAIILSIPKSIQGNSMDRLVIDNDIKSENRMKLEVTYVIQN